jgi:SMC interacting uncharacterized protein involved in chromosome segregation
MSESAAATQRALEQLEQVAAFLAKAPLHSAKQIEHAISRTREAAQAQQAFVRELQRLIDSVGMARDRQAAAADAINDSVQVIEERANRFQALQARFGALGEAAKSLNTLVLSFQEQKKLAGNTPMPSDLVEKLGFIESKMDEVIAEAKRLADEGRADELHDFARDADALRQQIQSARNRIGLVRSALTN